LAAAFSWRVDDNNVCIITIFISSRITFSASPTINSALLIPFALAFALASLIAASTISMSVTFLAFFDKNKEIVPAPQ
jgi:hypothetical protein